MNRWMLQLACLSTVLLNADSDTFSKTRLEDFYDQFGCEESQALADAGIGPGCNPTDYGIPVPTPPPPPPPGAIPPATIDTYYPLVISNKTGQPDSQVYVMGLPNNQTQFLTRGTAFPGQMTTVGITATTFSANPLYCIPLTSLQRCTTGTHDYIMYIPYSSGSRIYFSIGSPLYFPTSAGSISPPIGNFFKDPNYNVIYDYMEFTFAAAVPPSSGDIDFTITLDPTQVDNLSIPMQFGFYSYNPASPSTVTPYIGAAGNPSTNPTGYPSSTNRESLFASIVPGLTTGSAAGEWATLALPFHTNPYTASAPDAYLRIMAPKHQGTTLPQPQGNYTIPQFPTGYLTSNGAGFNYLDTIFAFYVGNTLYMQADTAAGSSEVYKGVVTGSAGNYVLTLTGTVNASYMMTLNENAITIANLFGGTPPFVNSGAPASDVGLIQNFFADAFVVGLLGNDPSLWTMAAPLNEANLWKHQPTNMGVTTPQYYTNNFPTPAMSVPGFDLYAQLLHQNAIMPTSPPYPATFPTTYGLCYAYDYDDTLNFSSTISLPNTTPTSANVYSIITLNPIIVIPTGVFDDSTLYNLTFNFTTGSFSSRQGTSGSFTPFSTGAVFSGVTSTTANPFQIQDNSGFIYNVFPKYQFLQPFNLYSPSIATAQVNGVIFTPTGTPTAPTGFTVQLN